MNTFRYEAVTDINQIILQFLMELCGLMPFHKGFRVLHELIVLYYQNQLPKRNSAIQDLANMHHTTSNTISALIVRVVAQVYQQNPNFVEAVMGRSLDRKPGGVEFARAAAEWLHKHQLFVVWGEEKQCFQWLPIGSCESEKT